jgi:uncharacterized protein YecE (DUF72 family)
MGDISISVYKNSNLTSETIQKTILELNENRHQNETVNASVIGGIKEYKYEYTDKEIKWLIKGIKIKKDFFLITLNWNLKDWNNYSTILMQSFNSFKAK